MVVYLVESHWGYGDDELHGIYSTLAAAEDVIRRLNSAFGENYWPEGSDIEEVEVDTEPARLLDRGGAQ